MLADAAHRASSSSVPARPRGHRLAVAVVWVDDRVVEKPSPPASMASCSSSHHGVDLLGDASLADGVGAHHVAAEGAVPDHEAGVDADAAVEAVEVLGERLPPPVDARLQGGQRHALDLGHHPAEVVGVLGVERGQREAAVAADDRGDAVDVRRRGQGSQKSWAS